jgi:hypothetical protein
MEGGVRRVGGRKPSKTLQPKLLFHALLGAREMNVIPGAGETRKFRSRIGGGWRKVFPRLFDKIFDASRAKMRPGITTSRQAFG